MDSRSLTDWVETSDPNVWGLLRLDDQRTVPVAFRDVGLKPDVFLTEELIYVGISDVVCGLVRSNGRLRFRYAMPTVFHEFVAEHEGKLLIQDEVGFVLLTDRGQEIWAHGLGDIVKTYQLSDGVLRGTTMEGTIFCVQIPSDP